MSRPTADERRRHYLETGAQIVADFSADTAHSATVDALANVRVAEIADRAGVTKGAVYHVWSSQEEYRKDLMARLLEQNRQAGVRELHDLLSDEDLMAGDPSEIMSRYADFVFDALKDDPAFFARFSFYVYASNPEVAELLSGGDDALVEDFTPLVDLYLKMLGRRVREPFTVVLILTAVNSLFQGLCLRYRTSPDLVEKRIGPRGLSMFAHGMESIILHFSEPVEPA